MKTGLPGSVRTPRILSAAKVTIPAGQAHTFDVHRYTNDTGKILFLKSVCAFFTQVSNYFVTDIRLGIFAANGSDIPMCWNPFVPYFLGDLSYGNFGYAYLNPGSHYRFKHPLVLLPGESIFVEANNRDAAVAVEGSIAFHGYTESDPVPMKTRYVPFVLFDKLVLAAGERAMMQESALRNDNTPFYVQRMLFEPFNTARNNYVVSSKIRIDGAGVDWMDRLTTATVIMDNSLSMPVPEFEIPPNTALHVEVENGAAETGHFYFGVLGYKALPL